MENKKSITNILAILSFILLILTAIISFNSASNSTFIQTYFILAVIGILIIAILINKDKGDILSVIGATISYFAFVLVRSVIYLLDRLVAFFRSLRLNNLNGKLSNYNYGTDEYIKLDEKIDKLTDIINRDTFGEILDIFCIIISIAVIVIVVMCIIKMFLKKDFSSTLIGKFTKKVISTNSDNDVKITTVENFDTDDDDITLV